MFQFQLPLTMMVILEMYNGISTKSIQRMTTVMIFQETLIVVFECLARLGCGMAGIPYDPVQKNEDK